MASAPRRVFLALVLMGVLAACGFAEAGTKHPVLLDEKEVLEEYLSEAERLELAPGDSWDSRPRQLQSDPSAPEGAMMFEKGVGEQTAQFQWYCSWAKVALSGGDGERQGLAQLDDFPTLSVWDAMDSNGHALFKGIAEEAARGNMGDLADYVADSCE